MFLGGNSHHHSEAQTPGDAVFKYYHLINHEAIKYIAAQS